VKFLEQSRTEIQLTREQWNQLNATFGKWLQEITIFTAEEAGSIVKRLGLILYRITMLFTSLRKVENGDMTVQQTCTDEDFKTALTLINIYLQHGLLMLHNLPKQEEAGLLKGGDNKPKFFEALRNPSNGLKLLNWVKVQNIFPQCGQLAAQAATQIPHLT